MTMRLVVLALVVLLSACAKPTSAPAPERNTGTLTILGTPEEEYLQGMVRAFQQETGIRTSYVRLSSGEALTRLHDDKGHQQFSVWWGGPADGYIAAAREDLIEPYRPNGFEHIPAQYKDANGVWTGVYVGALGLAVNTRVLQDRQLPEPTSWADLTQPGYQGLIAMAHPASSGTAYTMVATMAQLNNRDLDRTFTYLRDLSQNVRHYPRTGTAPARLAGQGEVAIGILFAHDTVAAIEEGFTDLKLVFPSEGTGYEIGGMALVKGGPDPIEAKQFMDWAVSQHAQELAPSFHAYQMPTNPDATMSEKAVKLASVKTINYDFQWAGDNKKAIVDRFISEIAPAPR